MMRIDSVTLIQRIARCIRISFQAGLVAAFLLPASAFSQSPAPLDLGCSEIFAVLAGSTVTSTGATVVDGNIGLSPGTGITGFPPATVVNGTIHINDALANSGKSCLTVAYNDAAGRTPIPTGPFLNPGSGNIGGLTLVAGLYKFTSSAAITGSDVTLTGGADDIWIFQIASDLNVGNDVEVVLAGGAQAKNIFWQVGTSATIGTSVIMKGTILADQSISLNTGAVLDGRAMARIGAVTMAGNMINKPPLDATLPMVISTVPADAAMLVPVDQTLSATFSEAMDQATITDASFILMQGVDTVDGVVSYNNLVASFQPTSNLSYNTLYTATITTGARDLDGNGLAGDYVWQFETMGASDTTAPTVVATIPANAATAVPIDQEITATFDKIMDPLTITSSSFILLDGSTPVAGTISYTGVTAMFTPTDPLVRSTVYTARITTAVRDAAGNPLANDYQWKFETIAAPDTIAPTVIATVPVNAAMDVPINQKITAAFDEIMDPLTINSSSFILMEGNTPVAGTVSYVGVTATFTPADPLVFSTIYTARITTAVQDLAGNPLAVDYVWHFYSGPEPDETAPTVRSTVPSNNATNVPVNQKLAATFSEAMDPSTISDMSFTLRLGPLTVPGSVVFRGLTATFTPDSNLTPNATYVATITTGVTDLAGNPMAQDYVWTFDTDVSVDMTAPVVVSTDPMNAALDVPVNKTISVTFSKEMDPLTFTGTSFTLRHGSMSVIGIISSVEREVSFTPLMLLYPHIVYDATITTQVTDLTGNALEMNYKWSFTTGPSLPSPLRVGLDCANSFTILGGSTVTSTGNSIVHGDIGLSPGTEVVGFPPGQVLNGSIHIGDALADNAKLCLTDAYNDAAGRTLNAIIVSDGELGGKTLVPGLYRSAPGAFAITSSDLTLDAQGDANAIWIFQMPASTLTVGNGRNVILAGGAVASNIFWQIGTSATIGTTADMKGTLMADQSIALKNGAVLNGRALARSGAVTMENNTAIRADIVLAVRDDLVPAEFTLSQNYPNPFNPITQIEYGIAKPGMVTLRIYNILGVAVATLVNSYQDAGNYSVSFDTNEATPRLESGMYFYRLEAGTSASISRKLILLK